MKFLIQRVKQASVKIDNRMVGNINKGLLVFVGVYQEDTKEICDKMIKKLLGLRIFADEQGKTNLNIYDAGGELLIVSQFTLCADCHKGKRPSFIKAGSPDMANELYEYTISECKKSIENVQHGEFGADMQVELVNDGPFTIMLDSEEL
jgi:D-tyrosyl-tRNA(Tyr) deacylase